MDSETSYKSAEIRTYFSDIGYKIEHTPPRDKHAGGIVERTVDKHSNDGEHGTQVNVVLGNV